MEPRKRGQTIHSQARNMIGRIIQKCDQECLTAKPIFALHQVNKRVSDYTGVSLKTVSRIRKESSQSGDKRLPSPGRKRPRCIEKKFHCSEEDRTIIRNIIYEFYTEKKIIPNATNLLVAIRERIDFPWMRSTLYKLLKSMGFQYKHNTNKKAILIEDPNIVNWRSRYLKDMQQYRAQNKPIVYMDKIWFDNNSCCSKCWQSEGHLGMLENKQSPHRLIVMHAGGKNGFINGAELIFKTNATSSGQIGVVNLEKWIVEKVLPNIPPNSIIVMGSALCHNVQLNKPPSKYGRKERMIEWLTENNIPYSKAMRKYELLEIVQKHKQFEKKYKIDELIRAHGHEVLRLMSYMRELNPFDMAWAQIKFKTLEKDPTLALSCDNLETFIGQALNEITVDAWNSFCTHIEKVEREYWKKDKLMEDIIENLNLDLQSSDSDDSNLNMDSSSSEDA